MDLASIRRLSTASRSALRGIRSTPMVFAVSVATMAAGLFLLGTYLLVVQNMRQVLEQFGHGLKLVAFLEPGAVTTEPEFTRLTIRVRGTVTETDTGSPVVGAEVFVLTLSLTNNVLVNGSTNTLGRYSLSFINADCILDFASLLIDHPVFLSRNIGLNCTEELQTVDVQLARKSP